MQSLSFIEVSGSGENKDWHNDRLQMIPYSAKFVKTLFYKAISRVNFWIVENESILIRW